MRSSARYHITALPTLGMPGSAPPLELSDLRERLLDSPWARQPIDVVLLQDDLTQRDSFLSGESSEVQPTVLTEAQTRNEAPLPEFLLADAASQVGTLETDRVWESYFRHASTIGREQGVRFLVEWVAFEVGLRNALAVARAQRLGLEHSDYRVAADLGESSQDYARAVEEWGAAGNPLAGQRALIMARWTWVNQHDAWFTFRGDELAAYAAKLLLLHQWHRLARAEEAGRESPASGVRSSNEISATLERINK